MDNPWLILAFLSVFHVIGATVLGRSLRGLGAAVRQRDAGGCRLTFLIVWGSMFGCLPFAFGLGLLQSGEATPYFLAAQFAVWGSVFLTVLLAGDAIRQVTEPFLQSETLLMLFGGGFIIAGLATAGFLKEEPRLPALAAGGIVALIGGVVFAYGLWKLLKSTT